MQASKVKHLLWHNGHIVSPVKSKIERKKVSCSDLTVRDVAMAAWFPSMARCVTSDLQCVRSYSCHFFPHHLLPKLENSPHRGQVQEELSSSSAHLRFFLKYHSSYGNSVYRYLEMKHWFVLFFYRSNGKSDSPPPTISFVYLPRAHFRFSFLFCSLQLT